MLTQSLSGPKKMSVEIVSCASKDVPRWDSHSNVMLVYGGCLKNLSATLNVDFFQRTHVSVTIAWKDENALRVSRLNSKQHLQQDYGRKQETETGQEHVKNALTEVRKAFGNAMVATRNYHVIHNLIHGFEEEGVTPTTHQHDATVVTRKMRENKKYMQRASTNMGMKTQTHIQISEATHTTVL